MAWMVTLVALATLQSGPTQVQMRVTLPGSLNYNLYLPEDYATSGDKLYPILMFLHGSLEAGDDFNLVNKQGPPAEVEKRHRKLPFILVSPQLPKDQGWDSAQLADFLNRMEAKYRVDKSREYVTGLSSGGYACYDLAVTYPDRFAAIAPVCGEWSGSPDTYPILAKTPIYATHGDRDPVYPFDDEQRVCEAVKAKGGEVVFNRVRRAKHDVWDRVYQHDDMYNWLLKHHR